MTFVRQSAGVHSINGACTLTGASCEVDVSAERDFFWDFRGFGKSFDQFAQLDAWVFGFAVSSRVMLGVAVR